VTDEALLANLSREIAALIARRDGTTLRALLAPGFVARALGGEVMSPDEFVAGVEGIPGEIALVQVEAVAVDVTPAGALVSGVQVARVHVDGQTIDDRRSFADWFVKTDEGWRLQAALDIPFVVEDLPAD
jgi:hypothetical protein